MINNETINKSLTDILAMELASNKIKNGDISPYQCLKFNTLLQEMTDLMNEIVEYNKRNIHEKTILISKKRNQFITTLLSMTGPEIYQKYGLKRDESLVFTADFGEGYEVDVKVVICEDEKPYTEAVLFLNGSELCCSDPGEDFLGDWELLNNNDELFIIHVIEEVN